MPPIYYSSSLFFFSSITAVRLGVINSVTSVSTLTESKHQITHTHTHTHTHTYTRARNQTPAQRSGLQGKGFLFHHIPRLHAQFDIRGIPKHKFHPGPQTVSSRSRLRNCVTQSDVLSVLHTNARTHTHTHTHTRLCAHLCFGDAVLGQFHHSEVALANGSLDVIETNSDGRLLPLRRHYLEDARTSRRSHSAILLAPQSAPH